MEHAPIRSQKKTGSLCASKIVLGLFLLFIAQHSLSATSAPTRVDGNMRNIHWSTVFTNTVLLSWSWNSNATSTKLDIAGMGGTFTTNFADGTTRYLWRTFTSNSPSVEDAYTLTLTVYSNGNCVAEAFTSRLAVVTGAFGTTAVDAVPNSPAWSKVKTDVVITYDAHWSEAATNAVASQFVIAKINGEVKTNVFADVAGYVGLKIRNSDLGYGIFDLMLSFTGTTDLWFAELTRPQDGTMVKIW